MKLGSVFIIELDWFCQKPQNWTVFSVDFKILGWHRVLEEFFFKKTHISGKETKFSFGRHDTVFLNKKVKILRFLEKKQSSWRVGTYMFFCFSLSLLLFNWRRLIFCCLNDRAMPHLYLTTISWNLFSLFRYCKAVYFFISVQRIQA
jgi:hypothetical protein